MASCMQAKCMLAICITVCALLLLASTDTRWDERPYVIFIFLAVMLNSFGDLTLITFRASGHFRREASIVTWTSLVHFGLLAAAGYLANDISYVSSAYFMSRLIYAVTSVIALRRITGANPFAWNGFGHVFGRVRDSLPFAVDSALTNVFAQLDVIIVSRVLGFEAAGVYQAGARVVQGIVPFTVALAGVHIPKLARLAKTEEPVLPRHRIQVIGEFLVVGLVLGLVLILLGPIFTKVFLGPSFSEVDALWIGFAVFTTIRFLATSLGVQLVAAGQSYMRAVAIIASGATTVALYVYILPWAGVRAVPWIAAIGMAVMVATYGASLLRFIRKNRRFSAERRTREP